MNGIPGVFEVELGRRLRRARQACGLSQRDAGDRLGVTFQQVQKYEAGIDRLPVAYLLALKELYRVSLGELVLAGDARDALASPRARATARMVRDFESIPSEAVRKRIAGLVRSLAPAGPPTVGPPLRRKPRR